MSWNLIKNVALIRKTTKYRGLSHNLLLIRDCCMWSANDTIFLRETLTIKIRTITYLDACQLFLLSLLWTKKHSYNYLKGGWIRQILKFVNTTSFVTQTLSQLLFTLHLAISIFELRNQTKTTYWLKLERTRLNSWLSNILQLAFTCDTVFLLLYSTALLTLLTVLDLCWSITDFPWQ